MARTRYLKPDFFTDEDIAELAYDIRIFYQGLWCYADKKGRLEDKPKTLKVQIMPYDDIDAEAFLAVLATVKKNGDKPFIQRYQVEGRRFIQILSWERHQSPHHTEKASLIPEPPPLTVTAPLNNAQVTEQRVVKEKEKDKEKKRYEAPESPPPAAGAQKPKQKGDPELKDVIDHVCMTYETRLRKGKYLFTGKHAKLLQGLVRCHGSAGAKALWDVWLESADEWAVKTGHSIEGFVSALPKLLDSGYKSRKQMYEQRSGLASAGDVLKTISGGGQ